MVKRVTKAPVMPLATNAPSRALVIRFEGAPQDPPNSEGGLKAQRIYYAVLAKRIVSLFYSHLPGGLVDAIFGELAMEKASLYRVAHAPGRRQK